MSVDSLIKSRFNSWDEIFPDPAEADRQYAALVNDLRQEYSGNEALAQERVAFDPLTGAEATVFYKTMGGYDLIARLDNGNVKYEFASIPGREVHTQEVIPQAGNKDHDWTFDAIVGLQAQVAAALAESSDSKERVVLATLLGYIAGKPATPEWEEAMLGRPMLTQRVGYKIYPDEMLELAKKKVGR